MVYRGTGWWQRLDSLSLIATGVPSPWYPSFPTLEPVTPVAQHGAIRSVPGSCPGRPFRLRGRPRPGPGTVPGAARRTDRLPGHHHGRATFQLRQEAGVFLKST